MVVACEGPKAPPAQVMGSSVIRGSVFVFAWFLEESGYVTVCFHLGVKGVKVLVVVHPEFLECLFFSFDASIGHFVIPFLQEGNSLSSAHFTKNEGDLDLIRGVNSWIDREVHFHGLEPL